MAQFGAFTAASLRTFAKRLLDARCLQPRLRDRTLSITYPIEFDKLVIVALYVLLTLEICHTVISRLLIKLFLLST